MLFFALGLVLGIILGEIIYGDRRYPPRDNSTTSVRNNGGDIIAVEKEEGERYWKKVVPSDVQRTPNRTIIDN